MPAILVIIVAYIYWSKYSHTKTYNGIRYDLKEKRRLGERRRVA